MLTVHYQDAVQEQQLVEWLEDQAVTVSITDIFQIEAKVVFKGLRLAWNKGFRQVELESDNALLIEILQTIVTNRLAKMISSDIEHFVVLEEPPHEIKTLLEEDTRSSILEESISN
ncbi:hypothetical protein PVK06_033540 [Gossypium arboreum]|uniref:RNase H type-1 domain-containing protein n=1 Tax=Gossypium arboreum TaxID=29729 RepID=A0ABR0NCM9_GOSAR|nr:hypothetical protein PVK06_033540 [Gossypium arboreum]